MVTHARGVNAGCRNRESDPSDTPFDAPHREFGLFDGDLRRHIIVPNARSMAFPSL